MEIINIETLEDLNKFLIAKHSLSSAIPLEDAYRKGLVEAEYNIYSFQSSGNINVSYNAAPHDLTRVVRKVYSITCAMNNVSIEETTYKGDRESCSTMVRHDYRPFDLLILFKGSSTLLYISLAAESEVVTTLKRYANSMMTHFDF